MHRSQLASVLLYAAPLAAAIPVAQVTTPPPPQNFTKTDQFTLVAKVTKAGSGITEDLNNYVVTTYHIGAAQNAAVLSKYCAEDNVTGFKFYTNGTGSEFQSSTSYVAGSGGESIPVYGWNMVPVTAGANTADVQINAGTGTQNVWVAGWVGNGPQLGYTYLVYNDFTAHKGGSQWYVCNQNLGAGAANVLKWHGGDDTTPAECAEVDLLAQVAGNFTDTFPRPYLIQTPAVDDATSITV